MPAYVMAYAYTDWLQFTGPVQTHLRALTGWHAREYWFPEIRSLYGAAAMLSFALYPYVYLLARTSFLELLAERARGRAARRLRGVGQLLPRRAAARAARDRRRHGARADGDARRLRRGVVLRGRDVHDRDLQGLARRWATSPRRASSRPACSASWCWCWRWNAGIAAARAITRRRSARRSRRSGCAAALRRGAFVACAAPVLFGFLLPTGILLHVAATSAEAALDARVLGQIANSVTVAGVAAAAAVGIAVLMAYAARLTHRPLVARATRASALGYAIPGAVIAVGILVPLGRLDNLARELDPGCVRDRRRTPVHRHDRRARVRLPRALSRGGAADGRGGARPGHAEHGGRGPQPGPGAARDARGACTRRCSRRASRRRRCSCSSTR